MTSTYRIKRAHRQSVLNRQRRRAVFTVVLALFSAWLLDLTLFNPTSIEAAQDDFTSVYVQSGDTLWSIAAKYKPEGEDLRNYVRLVSAVNGIDGNIITAGQTLIMP